MAEQELEITISPEGKVTVKTHGIKGEVCMEYADMFVQLLGREESREKTEEFYQTEDQVTHTRVQQRR